MKYQIDDTDRKILSYLVKNARMPFLEIARECGISGAAIHQRVRKMEECGIIEGSRFIVKPDALGYGVCAFIGVILDHAHTYKTVVKEIENIPEVVECHFITGNYTFLIKLRCNDHQHLMDILINTLQNIPGIAKTETFIALDQLIDKQININNDEKHND
ncbi:MAG: Lrp/AsnC ligand binding domain-containing protein [Marinifilaceae bacterium]|nr:Lrp/AsnC ligand binding domain-containing protein [Marinifilaceae bacterium]